MMKLKGRDMSRGERGFTLIEVMVALGILAFGILAIATMQVSGLSGTTKANYVTQRTVVAMDRMEQLMGMSYTAVQAESGTTTEGIYSINTQVQANTPIQNTLQITVIVTGQEKGVPRKTRLVCIRPQLI